MSNFSDVVEEVKKFDYESLMELNFITKKYIEDLERERLLKSHQEAVKEYQDGKLKFTSDFNELKKMLDELHD